MALHVYRPHFSAPFKDFMGRTFFNVEMVAVHPALDSTNADDALAEAKRKGFAAPIVGELIVGSLVKGS
jgi:hypothetical protein